MHDLGMHTCTSVCPNSNIPFRHVAIKSTGVAMRLRHVQTIIYLLELLDDDELLLLELEDELLLEEDDDDELLLELCVCMCSYACFKISFNYTCTYSNGHGHGVCILATSNEGE